MARKTFSVSEFKSWVNDKLGAAYIRDELKEGLIASLTHVLHETDNYNGFGYVYKDEERPCIEGPDGKLVTNPNWTESHDLSRVYY